jgi:hypothetical protein
VVQAVHAEVPVVSALNLPAAQAVHAEVPVASALKDPATHAVHTADVAAVVTLPRLSFRKTETLAVPSVPASDQPFAEAKGSNTVQVAAFVTHLKRQAVVATVEFGAFAVGKAAAHVAALQIDQVVQFAPESACFPAAERPVSFTAINAAVEVVFALADVLPAAAPVLFVTTTTVIMMARAIGLGHGRDRDGSRSQGEGGDEKLLHHRTSP